MLIMVLLYVAVAGPEADLKVFDDHRLYILPAKETLTFEHTYTWWGECPASILACWSKVLTYVFSYMLPMLQNEWSPIQTCSKLAYRV